MENREPAFLYAAFLGSLGEEVPLLKELIGQALERYRDWRSSVYPDRSIYPQTEEFRRERDRFLARLRQQFEQFMERMDRDSIPFGSARYAAQMLKDPGIPALLAYWYTQMTNPNNHAYEGGPPTTEMEMEVVEDLKKLVGFEEGWGHLTSGGTLANMEALWAVRDTYPPGKNVFSVGSHYSWKRINSILRTEGFVEVGVDSHYRMDLNQLEDVLRREKVSMVMANFGTTGIGAVDPIEEILQLREKYGFHLHIDAAYGGYTRSVILDENGQVLPQDQVRFPVSDYVYRQACVMGQADSITIDPHKHGLMAYGAGSVLYRHEKLRQVILNTAPYTYHVAEKPNIGMFTLEGSRPGASAAAVWLTHRVIPLHHRGFGEIVGRSLQTAREVYQAVSGFQRLRPVCEPDLDLFCFYRVGEPPDSVRSINEATLEIYRALSVEHVKWPPVILSKFIIDAGTARKILPHTRMDDGSLVAMRAVFLKHWLVMGEGKPYLKIFLDQLKRFDGNSSAKEE